ncbi:MAG: acyltransferase family protein [Deltaproteobacteria bacterium]|nr:acyltransferase family protein [Deltaproteobacteria bacterium]
MFAVVTLYSANTAKLAIGNAGWFQLWADFAQPFRMPDFFLLSGLFLSRVIERPLRRYLDKKVMHYAYFFVLWSLINTGLLYVTGERHGGLLAFAKEFWASITFWPFEMLWFIQMLPAYFLLTRLIRRVPVYVVFPIVAALQVFPLFHTERVLIDEFWDRYVYFYAGYAFAPFFFRFAADVQKYLFLSLCGFSAWIVTNGAAVWLGYSKKPGLALGLAFLGAIAVIASGALAEKLRFAGWLRYLGRHSIVVYLAFYWPMKLAAVALLPVGFFRAHPTLFAASISAVGILSPVVLHRLINWRTKDRWLFARPAWATLERATP